MIVDNEMLQAISSLIDSKMLPIGKELNEFKFDTGVFEHEMRKDVRLLQDAQATLITVLEHHKMISGMS